MGLNYAVINEIQILGVYSQDFRAVRPAIKMVQKGRFPFQDLISHTLPLADAEKAVLMVAGETGEEMPLKVLLDPEL